MIIRRREISGEDIVATPRPAVRANRFARDLPNLESGLVSIPLDRNKKIYKLRGMIRVFESLIPNDLYDDELTSLEVVVFMERLKRKLDAKRQHDYICDSCHKTLTKGKPAKSNARLHMNKKCCQCGTAHRATTRIHKDRLERLRGE